jgi:hypothetical protein
VVIAGSSRDGTGGRRIYRVCVGAARVPFGRDRRDRIELHCTGQSLGVLGKRIASGERASRSVMTFVR